MEKNLNTKSINTNLLKNQDFKEQLSFETYYGSTVKGGHFPYYYGDEKKNRLVNNVNLLSSKETIDLAVKYFIGKN